MEGLILLGLAGVGYVMNKDKDSHRVDTKVRPPVFQNSNASIYDLNNFKDAQNHEKQLVKDNFKKSMSPESNLVNDFDVKNKEVIIGLDGNPISREDFMKNDQGITMEPFFSGEGPAAVNFDDPRSLRSHQGGAYSEFYKNKREINLNLYKI